MFLIQEEKASSTELGFLKYAIYIRVVRLTDLFDLSQIKDRKALFKILIVIHSYGPVTFTQVLSLKVWSLPVVASP